MRWLNRWRTHTEQRCRDVEPKSPPSERQWTSIDSATSLFDPCGMMSWSAGRLQKGPAASAAHGATSIRKFHTLILMVFWSADGDPTSNQHQVDDDSWANFLWEEVVPLRSPFWPRDLRATTSLAASTVDRARAFRREGPALLRPRVNIMMSILCDWGFTPCLLPGATLRHGAWCFSNNLNEYFWLSIAPA